MTEIYAPPGFETNTNNDETLRPGDGPLLVLRGILKATQDTDVTLSRQRELEQIAYEGAIEVACDWLEATKGEAITEEEFQNLYNNGYASNSATEILGLFYDWEDYQTVAQSYFAEREDTETANKALVESLRQEAEMGLIPSVFFDKFDTYKVDNPTKGKKKLTRYRLNTEEKADDNTILQRYFKYLVANHVTRTDNPKEEVSEERKVNLALGFTLETKKPLSGFYSALRNSKNTLTEEQLMLTVEELGVYDYIYPDSRRRHLETLVEVGYYGSETLNQAAA